MAADEQGARRYLDQVARANFALLIDAWMAADAPERAREVAELAVRQGLWEHPMQRDRDHVAGVSARPVHDAEDFWFTYQLRERSPALIAEIEQALARPDGPFGSIPAGEWRRTCLFSDGGWHDEIAELLPVTRGVLTEIPEATTFSTGTTTLTRLAPGGRTQSRCADTNSVLTVQLGIAVPDGAGLRIGDGEVTWQPGRCTVVDRSFQHSVHNDGDTELVLLDIEIPHPDLAGAGERPQVEPHAPIAAFLRDRGMSAVEIRDGRVELTPDATSSEILTRYMSAAGVVGAERDGDVVHWHVGAPAVTTED